MTVQGVGLAAAACLLTLDIIELVVTAVNRPKERSKALLTMPIYFAATACVVWSLL